MKQKFDIGIIGAGLSGLTLGNSLLSKKINNFILFYDSNDVQLSSMTNEVTSENTAMKYEAWGWKVITINGHDHTEIRKALIDAQDELLANN